MKTGSTVGLAVVAAALVGGALYYGRQEEMEISQAAAPVKSITSGITSNTVERIEIAVPGEKPVTLRQKDQLWYSNLAEGHKADKGAVTALFQAIEKEISGEVVSSNPESFDDYQVSETSGTRVRIFESGKAEPSEDLLVGKDGGAAFNTYVREQGSNDVINANASLSFTFKRPDSWRDKQIMQIPQDAVTKIAGEGTSSTFELAKNVAGTWKVTKPDLGDAQPTKVNPILSNVANMRATDFAEGDAASLGLEPPKQKLTITYDDKETSPAVPKTVTLLIGDKKAENSTYYVKRGDSKDIYTIGEYLVTSFMPEPGSLALIPPKVEEETTATQNADTPTTGATDEVTTSAESAAPAASPEPAPAPTPEPTPAPTPEPTLAPTPAATPVSPAEDSATTSAAAVTVGEDAATSPTQ